MARLLIIDDSPSVLAFVQKALEPTGHELITASSARRAVALCGTLRPDAVITDIYMPDMDGFEVLTALRSHRIIAMSSMPQTFDAGNTALSLGAVTFLHKPFSPEQLINAVNAALAAPTSPAGSRRA